MSPAPDLVTNTSSVLVSSDPSPMAVMPTQMIILLVSLLVIVFLVFLLISVVYGCTFVVRKRKENEEEYKAYQNQVNEAKKRRYRNDYDGRIANIESGDTLEDKATDPDNIVPSRKYYRSNGCITYESLQIEEQYDREVTYKISRQPRMDHPQHAYHTLPNINQRAPNGNHNDFYMNQNMNPIVPNVHSAVPKVNNTMQYVNKAFQFVNHVVGNGHQRDQIQNPTTSTENSSQRYSSGYCTVPSERAYDEHALDWNDTYYDGNYNKSLSYYRKIHPSPSNANEPEHEIAYLTDAAEANQHIQVDNLYSVHDNEQNDTIRLDVVDLHGQFERDNIINGVIVVEENFKKAVDLTNTNTTERPKTNVRGNCLCSLNQNYCTHVDDSCSWDKIEEADVPEDKAQPHGQNGGRTRKDEPQNIWGTPYMY